MVEYKIVIFSTTIVTALSLAEKKPHTYQIQPPLK